MKKKSEKKSRYQFSWWGLLWGLLKTYSLRGGYYDCKLKCCAVKCKDLLMGFKVRVAVFWFYNAAHNSPSQCNEIKKSYSITFISSTGKLRKNKNRNLNQFRKENQKQLEATGHEVEVKFAFDGGSFFFPFFM